MVTVTPTATVSAACAGGPLHLNVHFEASYDDEGANWMNSVGAWFSYDGNGTAISNFQDSPMRWDVAYLKQLPACPTTRQSGSMDFDAGDSTDGLILTIIFNWHYRCDCRCNEVEPFKASYTYFAFPPLRPPPRPGAGLSTML
jgi:hypothetical protein